MKVPKNTVASIILKWKRFDTTKTLPRAGYPTKLSNQGRRALVREVTKNPMVTLTELQSSLFIQVFLIEIKSIFQERPGPTAAGGTTFQIKQLTYTDTTLNKTIDSYSTTITYYLKKHECHN